MQWHLVASCTQALKDLEVLRKPSVSPELFYKFATGLVTLAPGPTVQAWMDAQPPLDPRSVHGVRSRLQPLMGSRSAHWRVLAVPRHYQCPLALGAHHACMGITTKWSSAMVPTLPCSRNPCDDPPGTQDTRLPC